MESPWALSTGYAGTLVGLLTSGGPWALSTGSTPFGSGDRALTGVDVATGSPNCTKKHEHHW